MSFWDCFQMYKLYGVIDCLKHQATVPVGFFIDSHFEDLISVRP